MEVGPIANSMRRAMSAVSRPIFGYMADCRRSPFILRKGGASCGEKKGMQDLKPDHASSRNCFPISARAEKVEKGGWKSPISYQVLLKLRGDEAPKTG